MRLQSRVTYQADDLTVWKQHICDGSGIQWPMNVARTNPVPVGDAVIVSLCSPRQIASFHRATGERIWKIDLDYLANGHVDVANEMIYGGTSKTVMCIDPADGSMVWSYTPYEDECEHFYSSPAFSDNRLIIGDNIGWVHCVDTGSGTCLWKVKPANAGRCAVNSTACVFGDRVVVCTVRGVVAAYEISTGKQIWRIKYNEGSIYELLNYSGDVLIPSFTAAYQFKVSNGDLVHCWQYDDHMVGCAVVAGSRVFTVLKNLAAEKLLESGRRKTGSYYNKISLIKSIESLASLLPDRVQWKLDYSRYQMSHLKWNEANGLLYEATSTAIGIVDIDAGVRISEIVDADKHGISVGFSQPAVVGDLVYAFTNKGDLYCLRHPPV